MKRVGRMLDQGLEHLQPDTLLGPPVVAIVDRRVGAVALRKVAPGGTGAQNIENAADHPAIVDAGNAPRLVRKQRPDNPPLQVSQIVTTLHHQAPAVWKLESQSAHRENPLYGYRT